MFHSPGKRESITFRGFDKIIAMGLAMSEAQFTNEERQ